MNWKGRDKKLLYIIRYYLTIFLDTLKKTIWYLVFSLRFELGPQEYEAGVPTTQLWGSLCLEKLLRLQHYLLCLHYTYIILHTLSRNVSVYDAWTRNFHADVIGINVVSGCSSHKYNSGYIICNNIFITCGTITAAAALSYAYSIMRHILCPDEIWIKWSNLLNGRSWHGPKKFHLKSFVEISLNPLHAMNQFDQPVYLSTSVSRWHWVFKGQAFTLLYLWLFEGHLQKVLWVLKWSALTPKHSWCF